MEGSNALQLTSFAGLVVFQKLFETCRLKERLQEACAHLEPRHYYGFSTILQCLIVHIVLGYRQLRESAFYREDPLVKRVLGLKSLPSVATVSRMLSEFDGRSVAVQQAVSRDIYRFQRHQQFAALPQIMAGKNS